MFFNICSNVFSSLHILYILLIISCTLFLFSSISLDMFSVASQCDGIYNFPFSVSRKSSVFKNSFTGRPFHVNTKALIGNSLLTFASFDTLLDVDTKNKDINTVKVLGNYYGVSCDLNDKNIRYEWVNEVYRDVLDKYSSVLKSKFDREDFDYYLDVIR